MRRRTVWTAVTAWVAVVAVASGITWVTISSAGRQVLSTAPLPPLAPAASPTGGPSSTGPTATTSPRRSRHERAPTTRPSQRPPSADPAVPLDPAPTGLSLTGPVPRETPRPTPRETTGQAPRDATWSGEAGVVRARCSADDVSLLTATPADGYGVEVESRGPHRVELTFRGKGREVELRAECDEGAVSYRIDADRDD